MSDFGFTSIPVPNPPDQDLSVSEVIEEAHGLWELAVVRVSALAEVAANDAGDARLTEMLLRACRDERAAFSTWRRTAELVLNPLQGIVLDGAAVKP